MMLRFGMLELIGFWAIRRRRSYLRFEVVQILLADGHRCPGVGVIDVDSTNDKGGNIVGATISQIGYSVFEAFIHSFATIINKGC